LPVVAQAVEQRGEIRILAGAGIDAVADQPRGLDPLQRQAQDKPAFAACGIKLLADLFEGRVDRGFARDPGDRGR